MAENDEENLPKNRSDLDSRLGDLGRDLKVLRPPEEAARSDPSDRSAIAKAVRFSAEFISGVLAGGALGWLVDHFAGTKPWGLIVFVLLGFCAGMLNLLREAGLLKTR